MNVNLSNVFTRKTHTQHGSKVLRMLSIDWDVFHDMTQFMPGSMECQEDWIVEYSRWEGEFKHSYKFATKEFECFKKYLSSVTQIVYIAEDHKELYHLIERDTEVHVTNLDFHDDMYEIDKVRGAECGSWASALVELKDCDVTIDWRQLYTKGLISKQRSEYLDKRIKWSHQMGFDTVFNQTYDIIFLCRSWDFSPPHMGHKFRELQECCDWRLVGESIIWPSYTDRYEYWRDGKMGFIEPFYFPTGQETAEEMDAIHDDHDNLVVHPVSQISNLPECDPLFRQ